MYSNETIDNLMREGIGTMNETVRRQVYNEIQMVYHDDCPSVPLYQSIGRRFERDWVKGWYYNPLVWSMNYFYVQWKGSMPTSTRYSWPMFHHDLKHTGYTESPAPNTNNTLWNYTTGNYVVSSPAVVNGKVYVGSWDGNVYCLDALAGACIWNYTTGGMVGSSPAVVNERLYIGSYDFKVYCLDASTGAQIWNYTTSDSRISSPAVVNGRVYVGSGNTVYALNASTGAHIWDYITSAIVRSSPAVVDGRVYVGSGDFKLYALDAVTGLHIWNYTTGNSVNSSPSVVDGKVYVGSDDRNVYCLNAATGERIWNYTTGSWVSGSPAVAYGKVYVGSYDHRVYALDALTGTHIWNYTTEDEMYGTVGTPAVADDKVYIGSGDGCVYTLSASTGAKIWKYGTGGPVGSSPAVADGIVYFGSTYDHKVWAIGNIIKSGDYRTVQEAIDAASPGATVIIAPGIYHESIVVNKTLTIIGLPGSDPTFSGGGSGIAITLLSGASGSIIAGIVITHWDQGILIIDATNVKVYDNIMSLINCNGITLEGSNAADNLIYSNIFQENTVAINLTASATSNTIYKNIITLNNIGLRLESSGNNITANIIAENQVGIDLSNSNNNIIYHNNFISNDIQVSISTSTGNTWDNGYPSGGNYWSIHTHVDLYSGSNQNQQGSDGINDTQYTIAINNVDRYPLVHPFNAHDIGIQNVITAKTVIGQGYTSSIDLKIINYGMYDENFIVITYANTFIITTQTITLTKRNSTIVTSVWDTAGFAYGNYTVSAYAWPVQGETSTGDNTFTDGTVIISHLGDITGDGKCDIQDLARVSGAFGSRRVNDPNDPKYGQYWHPVTCSTCPHTPNADITNDAKIDIQDLARTSANFGWHQ
jgi:parallel beta-helix repeat protein